MKLKNEVKERSLDENTFMECDEKVQFYTGLGTWELLYLIFTSIKPYLKERSSLTPFSAACHEATTSKGPVSEFTTQPSVALSCM